MNFIRRFLALILILASGTVPAQSVLDSLSGFLYPPGGLVLKGTIYQKQYDQEWRGQADVILIQKRDLGLLTDREFIRVNQDTIWTYNRDSRQVLIDSYSWEQFNLFALLSGDFRKVDLGDLDRTATGITQYFSIADMGISGYLELNKNTKKPEFLRINYDANNWVEIRLTSVSGPASLPELIHNLNWEVIDLRE
ncbi:MAG: hypothetical protein ACE5D1_05950 [Fidelibacterota bacterium]